MVSPDVLTTAGISHYPVKVIFRRYTGPTAITTFVSFPPVDEMLIPHSRQSTTFDEDVIGGGME